MLRPLARHEGLWRYTEGQRRGLGIAHSEPLYVLRKQGEDNTLVVGGRARLGMHGCLTGPANLLCPPEQWPDTLLARLRHRQRPTPARVEITDGGLRITLAEPQFPSAPGQVAAIYDEQGRVLAGALALQRESHAVYGFAVNMEQEKVFLPLHLCTSFAAVGYHAHILRHMKLCKDLMM